MPNTATLTDSAPGLSRLAGRTRQVLSRRAEAAEDGDSGEVTRRAGVAAIASRRDAAEAGNPLARLAAASRRLRDDDSTETSALAAAVETAAASETAQTAAAAEVAAATPTPVDRSLEPLPDIDTARAQTIVQTQLVGKAAIAAATRLSVSRQANRVKDGFSLGVLSATSGNAAGVQQRSSGLMRPGNESRASLFDRSSSGQGLVDRLRGQVRPSSPLNALGSAFGARESGGGPLSALRGRGDDGGSSGLSSLSRANAQRTGLSTSLASLDGGSRRLLSAASPNRTSGGFGLASTSRSAFDLIG